MSDWAVTLVVAIIAAIPGIYALVREWRKSGVDLAAQYQKLASMEAGRIATLKERVDVLETEVDLLKCELDKCDLIIREWQAGINLLLNQLVANSHVPVWTPKDRK